MASPGRSAGRVSIRVVPDSTRFRAELKASLDKIERDLQVHIEANLDRAKFDEQMRKLASAKQTVTVNADLDDGKARAQLAVVARTRVADIKLRLNKASLVKVGTALAALSGARGVLGPLGDVGVYLGNLDRHIPKIAATALAVGSIGSLALSSVSGLLSLSAGLAQVAGAAIVLPGILAGFGVGLATFAIALKDAPKALKSLAPAFKSLQKTISGNFWAGATAPVKNLVTSLLPQLKSGLGGVASSLGGFTASLAGALSQSLSGNVLTGLFKQVADSIRIASAAVQPLVQALVTVGTVGGTYLPRLADLFVELSQRFNAFVQGAAADGSLQRWISNGLTALRSLGSVVASVAGILGALFKAADAAGTGNGLVIFAGVLKQISDVMNGPAFQGALKTLFQGAAAGAAGLASAIRPIGALLATLAPTIASVMATAGTAIGGLLSQLAAALSSPAFSTGLSALFAGIAAGLAAIGPALPGIVTAFGALAGVAGTLAATMGAVLGAALQALAPILTILLAALQPIIPILGDALVGAITTLAPALLQIVAALASGLGPLITALVPLIVQLAPLLAQILTSVVPLIPSILQIATGLVQLLGMIVQLNPAFQMFADLLSAAFAVAQIVLGTIGALFAGNFGAIPGIVSAAGQQFIAAVDAMTNGAYSKFVGFVAKVIGTIAGWLVGMYLKVVTGFSQIRQSITLALAAMALSISAGWTRMVAATVAGILKVVILVAGLPGRARAALGNLGSYLYSAGADLVRGFINGIGSMIGTLVSRAADMARSALAAAKSALGIGSPSKEFAYLGRMSAEGFLGGFDRNKSQIDKRLRSFVNVPSIPGSRLNVTGLTGATPTGSGGLSFGDVYGHTAEDVARAVVRLLDEREALQLA